MDNVFSKIKYKELNYYCNFCKKGIFDISPTKYKTKGIPLIRTSEIKHQFIDFSTTVFLDKATHNFHSKTELKEGDILFTKIGAYIGDVAILPPKHSTYNFSQNVAGLSIKQDKINSYFLITYLLSKYSRKQILRIAMLSGQGKLELKDIKKIKIPILSYSIQINISSIVENSYNKLKQSKHLYEEAEQMLLKELSLLDYKPKQSLSFEATSNEVANATRFDAEYFQPKYDEINEHIENYSGGFSTVKNILNWKKGIEVGSSAYTKQGKEFVRVSDFSIFGVEEASKKISDSLFSELKGTYQPKKDDILFTKDGTIGITSVLKSDIDGVLSSAFLTLSLKEKYENFEKECLALILNSIISKMQVEQLSGGAIIAHLKPSDFETFKIPIIIPEIQKQIAEKIQESFKLRKESIDLLAEAKRKVEEEIEKE